MFLIRNLLLYAIFLLTTNLFAPPPQTSAATLLCINPSTGEKYLLYCVPIKTTDDDSAFLERLINPIDEFVLLEDDSQAITLVDENGECQLVPFQAPIPNQAEDHEETFELLSTNSDSDPFLFRLNSLVATTKYYFERSLKGSLILMHQDYEFVAELSPNFFLKEALKKVICGGKSFFCFATNLFYGAVKTAEFSEFLSILFKAYLAGNLHFE